MNQKNTVERHTHTTTNTTMKLLQDDIFGVVPFLLAKEGVAPKSGLTFTAKDPITVVFSIDTSVLKVCMLLQSVYHVRTTMICITCVYIQ